MFIYKKTDKLILGLICFFISYQAYPDSKKLNSGAFNTYAVSMYSSILDKLLLFKNDRFKVFYGGPVSRNNGQGVKWIMPIIFQDEQYKTRALYDVLFVNCDPENANGAKILFLNVSDANVKFKNLLSEDYKIFHKIIIGKYSKNKYIVIRQMDFGMVHYPDIFISSLFSRCCDGDMSTMLQFLNQRFRTERAYKTIFKTKQEDIVLTEDDQRIVYEPILMKTEINNNFYSYYVTKIIIKNDNWKLYYIATKNKNYKNIATDKVLTRLDSGCVSGQIYGDDSCDCAEQLYEALKSMVENVDFSVVIHIPAHDGRGFGTALKAETEIYKIGGIGRVNEVKHPLNTIEASKLLYGQNPYDLRTYDGAATILKTINVKKVLLITDSLSKTNALIKNGIKVTRVRTNSNKPSCIKHLLAKRNSDSYYSE